MKILKIAIVLVPLLAAVSCQKSGIRPSNCNEHEDNTPAVASKTSNTNLNQSENSSTEADNADHNAKKVNGTVVVEAPTSGTDGTEIIGSGDDDRDGGDKKKKLIK